MLLTLLVLVAELPSQRDVPYIVFPLLIWAALRFGPRGASLSLLLVSGLTVLNTAHNTGPFVRVDHRQPALHSAVPRDRGAELARPGCRHRRAGHRHRGAARQRGAAAVGRALHGRGVDRPRGWWRHHRVQRGRGAADRAEPRPTSRPAPRRRDRAAVDERGEPLTGGQLLGDRALTDNASDAGIVARMTRPDGSAVWVSASSGPVRDAAGRIAGVVTSLSDITSRRRRGAPGGERA